jgi:hypothetical protein
MELGRPRFHWLTNDKLSAAVSRRSFAIAGTSAWTPGVGTRRHGDVTANTAGTPPH